MIIHQKNIAYILLLLTTILSSACGDKNKEGINRPDRKIARVHDKYLYFRDLDSTLFVRGMGKDDSLRLINLYTEQWIQKQVLLHEAEANVGSNPEIEKLVQDYRNALLTQQYETALVKEKLKNTPFTASDYQTYYNENQAQYVLETSMLRCYFVKAKQKTADLALLRGMWQGGTFPYNDVLVFCNQHTKDSVLYSLEENTWHELEFLVGKVPANLISTAIVTKNLVADAGGYTYFVRVLDYTPAGKPAPYSYVEKDIAEIMEYRRRSEYLEQVRRDLYEKAKNNNKIEVF